MVCRCVWSRAIKRTASGLPRDGAIAPFPFAANPAFANFIWNFLSCACSSVLFLLQVFSFSNFSLLVFVPSFLSLNFVVATILPRRHSIPPLNLLSWL